MDRRKRTGVALAAGLLFLFVTEILLLFLAGNSLYKEEQGKLGALVLSHPEQETEYIELFDRGKQRNRQEEEAGNRNGDGFCGRTWSFMGFVFAK